LRTRTGRPHWIVIDETHHLLPAGWGPAPLTLPQDLFGLLLITLEPDHVAAGVLQTVDTVIAIGANPEQTISNFCQLIETAPPPLTPTVLEKGEALVWSRPAGGPPRWVRTQPPSGMRRRHHRKYAEGELDPAWSFYFRGPAGKLNLRAQNLIVFLQLADGVDDDTWLYHLRRHEYSTWFRDHIKDADLAAEAAQIETDHALSPTESRARIRQAVEQRYTAPA
jgi:hypothetical protein